MQPTHKVELFGSISAPANSLGTQTVCVKILDINTTYGFMSTFKLSGRGGIKIGVFRAIVRFISKNIGL